MIDSTSSKTLIIVVGPSGAGKSVFVEKAISEVSGLVDIVTFTTRNMRKGESEGVPYHFVDEETFRRHMEDDFFVETAEVHGNHYGSPRNQMEKAWEEGQGVIMDVDVQGARDIKAQYPFAKSIFILPPSIDELRRRVEIRDGGAPADLDLRMENAVKEMALSDQFDYQLVNEELDSSYAAFKKVVEEILNKH